MKKNKTNYVLSLMLVFGIMIFLSLPFATANPLSAPRIKAKDGTSTNWAGYSLYNSAKNPKNGLVNEVSGVWVVPTVNCTTTPTSYSATWVGIDGYSSGTVEQIGTDSDCSSGTPSYYAWYEMYPKWPYSVGITISPNDLIYGDVKYLGASGFQLVLTDLTTGKSFTTVQKSTGAKRTSGEWIIEAPFSGGVLPLANFGKQYFQNASINVDGKISTIKGSSLQTDSIDMVTSSGSPKAKTSSLSSDGSTFSVQWISS